MSKDTKETLTYVKRKFRFKVHHSTVVKTEKGGVLVPIDETPEKKKREQEKKRQAKKAKKNETPSHD